MALHGLRETAISRLLEAEHGDAVVALRSGHRGHWSFSAYQNLKCRLGVIEQEDILVVSSVKGSSSNAVDSAKLAGDKFYLYKQIIHQAAL